MTLFRQAIDTVDTCASLVLEGRITGVSGLIVMVRDFPSPVGAMCRIYPRNAEPINAQSVGFRGGQTVLMPLTEMDGLAPGDRVVCRHHEQRVALGPTLLGRVIDGMGRPIDGQGEIVPEVYYPLRRPAPKAMGRRRISDPIGTGVRAIDGLNTVGRGQRLGLFAGTGVGKSVLMGMIARYTSADVTVVALIGERGREVRDFLDKDLGDSGRGRSVVVVATSDQSPLLRTRACFVATSVAEYFRDQGKDVLLLMDSLTRLAMAQRQIGLASGEPPATKGYPPSAFAMLPPLVERCGRTPEGSITGFYTVLVEGDDLTEPVADSVRGILDGHLWLSRRLASRAHWPAVDVLESISRVMPDIVDEDHLLTAHEVRRLLATYAEIEDLVNIGAYTTGTTPAYDLAIQAKPLIDKFLRQRIQDGPSFAEIRSQFAGLGEAIQEIARKVGAVDGPAATNAASATAVPAPVKRSA